MKKLLLATALLLGLSGGAWAQKSKSALTTEVNTNLASNSNISASILRTTLLDLINSFYDLGGASTLSCGVNNWIAGFPTLSSINCIQPSFSSLLGTLTAAQFPALTGDVTTTAGALATTLATVNANVGTFGSATSCVTITNNAKGLTTAISAATCTPAIGSVTGLGTGVATALGVNVGTAGSFVTNGGALGTPTSGVATNLTGTAAGLTAGNVTTNANLTGPITSVGNATTVTANAITNPMLATMAANTVKANNTGLAASPADLTPGQIGAMLCAPQRSVFTTGTNLTYTTPLCNGIAATSLDFEMVGGGGGGGGSGTTPGVVGAGGNTCWNTSGVACTTPPYLANGGQAGLTVGGTSLGGTATGCDINLTGGSGGQAAGSTSTPGGAGGSTPFGGAGTSGVVAGAGLSASANTGGGGGGAGDQANVNTGGGGGAGGYCRKLLAPVAASYVYTVGAAGAAGAAGTGGFAGGAGGSGIIVVTARWQ